MENTKNKKAFVFIGRSGCGKGTQAELLIEYLKKQGQINDHQPLFYVETGNRFRDFIKGTSYSSRLSKGAMERSERQPDFLAVWNWSHLLVENLMGDELLIFDGTPRSLPEAQMLDTAFKFYGYDKPVIINMDVSVDWAKKRLSERGRGDDKKDSDIEKRLAWYETDVVPAIKFYENNTDYNFIRINGEQTIEEVNLELISKVFPND